MKKAPACGNLERLLGRYAVSRPSYQGFGRRSCEQPVGKREFGVGAET